MYNPQFTLTPKLLANVTQIERFYGQIESLRLPSELELNLEKHNMIASSYASNKIEGNPMTLPEVTNLILGDRVPINRDEREVKNYFHILMDMQKYIDRPYTVDLVNEFHKRLMTGVDETAGMIRNVQVVVGKYKEEKGNVSLKVKHNPPFHTRREIARELTDLLAWVAEENTLPAPITTGLFHHQFVYIHPYEDGNGRVCRLISALLFIRRGYKINKYFVLDDYYDIDRDMYSDMLHAGDLGDTSKWLEYYTDGIKYSLQGALHRAKQSILTLRYEQKPSPKEREVLQYISGRIDATSHDIASHFDVSRQQAHALLRNLVEKGLIEKKGTTKSSRYLLKQ